MPAFDFSKLRGRISEKCGSIRGLAAKSGISEGKLYPSLQGHRAFRSSEIERIIKPDCLDIPAEQISDYFFTLKVR